MQIPILAIIVPCYNEEECINSSALRLLEILNNLISNNAIDASSFIFFVDDGSSDNSWNIISGLHNSFPDKIKAVKFSKNFGNQKALLAGLLESKSYNADCFITIDADLQQDEEKIAEFVQKYSDGAQIVCGIRNDRKTDGFLKKFSALAFYKFMNILGVNIKVNHSDYRLIGKRALSALAGFHETNLFLRGMFNDIGFKKDYVFFDVKPRKFGKSKFNLLSLLSLAINGITSFSIVPLRFVSFIGILMSLFSFFIAIYAFVEYYYFHSTISGWTTIVVAFGLIGGIQILCLGIIGEYLGQLFYEVKNRPRYIIEDKIL